MKLPGQFPGSQSGVGSDVVNNQLGAVLQHSLKSNQDSGGLVSYSPLSVGLGGSRADLEIMSNTSGLGAHMPTNPYVMDRASDEEQVNLSLLPPVPCSTDRPGEHRQCPEPNPRPTAPSSTTPKQ
jgi:hypothetical protein